MGCVWYGRPCLINNKEEKRKGKKEERGKKKRKGERAMPRITKNNSAPAIPEFIYTWIAPDCQISKEQKKQKENQAK